MRRVGSEEGGKQHWYTLPAGISVLLAIQGGCRPFSLARHEVNKKTTTINPLTPTRYKV